jgi:hypothetical protein
MSGVLMCFGAGCFEFLELKVVCVTVIKIKRYETGAECIYDYPVVSVL